MAARTEAVLDVSRPLLVRSAQRAMAYLRQGRAALRWTQRELSERSLVPQSTLAGWENVAAGKPLGKNGSAHMPRFDQVLRVLDVLGFEMVIRPKRGDR